MKNHWAKLIYFIYIVSIGTIVSSCSLFKKEQPQDALVTIGDNYLLLEDVNKIIPLGTSSADSALLVEGYIRRWAIDVLMYNNAKSNISNKEEIERMVEDYRRSLTIHNYRQNVVKERISTPTESEAIDYYLSNLNDFKLTDVVMKAMILRLPNSTSQLQNWKKKINRFNNEDIEEIEKFALQNAIYYSIFIGEWKDINNIEKQSKLNLDCIKDEGYYEISDSLTVTLINVTNFRDKEDIMPQEMAIDLAKDQLYNNRKMDFLRDFGSELYEKAKKSGEIIFENE
ncbi:MAG: hypothetical protein R3Y59_02125 [bacterium]